MSDRRQRLQEKAIEAEQAFEAKRAEIQAVPWNDKEKQRLIGEAAARYSATIAQLQEESLKGDAVDLVATTKKLDAARTAEVERWRAVLGDRYLIDDWRNTLQHGDAADALQLIRDAAPGWMSDVIFLLAPGILGQRMAAGEVSGAIIQADMYLQEHAPKSEVQALQRERRQYEPQESRRFVEGLNRPAVRESFGVRMGVPAEYVTLPDDASGFVR